MGRLGANPVLAERLEVICIVSELGLGHHSLEDGFGHEINVQTEAVGTWPARRVELATVVFLRPYWVPDAARKDFGKDLVVREYHLALTVDIDLRIGYALAQLEKISTRVLYLDWLCLVATRPNYKVCLRHVRALSLNVGGLNQLDTFLLSVHHLLVQTFGVAPQTSKRVHVAVAESSPVVVCVAKALGLLRILEKYSDLAPVEDLYAAARRQLKVAPLLVLEIAKALANAVAVGKCLSFCLFCYSRLEPCIFLARAAVRALFYLFSGGDRRFFPSPRNPVEQHPRAAKAGVTASNNNDLAVRFECRNCACEACLLEERVR